MLKRKEHEYSKALNNSAMINFRNDVDLFKYVQNYILIINQHSKHIINALPKLFNIKGMPQYNVSTN